MIIITMDADAGLEFLNRLSIDLKAIVKFLRFNTKLGCWLRSHSLFHWKELETLT